MTVTALSRPPTAGTAITALALADLLGHWSAADGPLYRLLATRIARLADTSGVLGPGADEVHRVVSPLAMECRVPFERRFIFAGLADRMSTFGHARRLWLHWDRPAFETYPGGHVGFFLSPGVKRFVDEALRRSYTSAAAA